MRRLIIILGLLAAVTLQAQQLTPLQQAQQLQAAAAALKAQTDALVQALTPPAVVTLSATADLGTQLAGAVPGGAYCLPAGTYHTTLTLPNVAGASASAPVTLTTCTPIASGRASTSTVTIDGPSTASEVLNFAKAAGFWNVIGIGFTTDNPSGTIIAVGEGTETAVADEPHDIVLDRLIVDGKWAAKRGIALNGVNVAFINSTCTGIMKAGQDTQCVDGWNGPGPFLLQNDLLNGGTEVVMFGGADPVIPNLVPSNIQILGSTLTRTVSVMQPVKQTVKTTLELKNAQHVLVDGCILENSWVDGQVGQLLDFTPRNQGNTAPWSTLVDVTVQNSVLRHGFMGANLLGQDDINSSQRFNGLTLRNNLWYDIGTAAWNGGTTDVPKWLVVANGLEAAVVDHQTVIGTPTEFLSISKGKAGLVNNLTVTNSILPEGKYGIAGDGTTTMGLASWTPNVDAASVLDWNQINRSVTTNKWTYPGTHNVIGAVTFSASDAPSPTLAVADGSSAGCDLSKLPAFDPTQ